MKMIAIAALLMGFHTFAAPAPKAKSESKSLALPDFSGLQQPSQGSKDGISFSADMKCQTNDGQSFKASETGFDTCMANQKGKQQ